jgi:hypothetical protein
MDDVARALKLPAIKFERLKPVPGKFGEFKGRRVFASPRPETSLPA